MIETDYHILPPDVFHEVKPEADELGVSVDYYLMEFCSITDEDWKQQQLGSSKVFQ